MFAPAIVEILLVSTQNLCRRSAFSRELLVLLFFMSELRSLALVAFDRGCTSMELDGALAGLQDVCVDVMVCANFGMSEESARSAISSVGCSTCEL